MKKILIAMSGGVDSAVCAHILKERGFYIEGATLLLHDCVKDEVKDAKKVCDFLGIKHHVFEFKKDFSEIVVKNFIESYVSAKTPNPCIVCNENIKFGALLQKAIELGFDKLATGHYARIEKKNNFYRLRKAADEQKDQSYVLYRLSQAQLGSVLFPLGDMTKKEVRKIAQAAGIPSAHRAESQENCFIEGTYTDFLLKKLGASQASPGDIFDTNGKKLGKHKGLIYYTIGQRSGLGLTTEKPVYVINIDAKNNALVVGPKEEIYSKEAAVEDVRWSAEKPAFPVKAFVKIRRMHKPASAEVFEDKVVFDEPQASVTPGQSAVFYDDKDFVIGGGFITAE
ncbi:MAG: tRNA 2-thiouridine(34) synthase MnmA [Endomicrobia bacterium]|nr:tRNA 2-thiouridine(34) synthase MnmA [Endomicrobiia bacterium]